MPAAPARAVAATPCHDPGERERPQQIELLLDRQAPRVVERRRRREEREVVVVPEHVPPVRDVRERGERVDADPMQLARLRENRGVDPHEREHEEERGQEAAGPPSPERYEMHRPRGPGFDQQQRRDQVARENEEQVDAEVAARHAVGVKEQHGDHGDPADTVEGAAMREPRLARHARDHHIPVTVRIGVSRR